MSQVARLKRTGSQNKTNYYNNQLVNHFKPERGVVPELEEDVPSGCIIAYTGPVDPKGWYICDGRTLSTQLNPDLYSVIGTQFGTDGPYTFKLPDLRGSFLRGAGTNATHPEYAGSALNAEQTHATQVHHHKITDPSHNHGITDPQHNHGITDPGHIHTQTTVNDDFNSSGSYPNYTVPSYAQYDSAGTKTWTNTINSSTTGISVNNASTNITVNNHATGITVNDLQSDDTNVSGHPPVLIDNKETRPFNLGINWIIKA